MNKETLKLIGKAGLVILLLATITILIFLPDVAQTQLPALSGLSSSGAGGGALA